MPSVLSLAELDDQHVELLPGRTVLSMFVSQPTDGGSSSDGSDTMDLLRMTTCCPSAPVWDGATTAPILPAIPPHRTTDLRTVRLGAAGRKARS